MQQNLRCECVEFDRVLLHVKITQWFLALCTFVVACLAAAPVRGETQIIEEYVAVDRNLLPVELVVLGTPSDRVIEVRQELKKPGRWRLTRTGDQGYYPGKCFITIQEREVSVSCAVGTYSDAPWALTERPRRTLAPRSYDRVSDAIATILNFSRASLREYHERKIQESRLENTI